MGTNLTHVKKLRDPNYFGAYELITGVKEDGSMETVEMNLTITKVVNEKLKTQEGGNGMVVYFSTQKPMVFNAVNTANTTKAIGSPMAEHWIGKTITVYVEVIKAFGKWQEVVRVRPNPPAISLPNLNPSHEKWTGARKAILDGNTTVSSIRKKYVLTPENEKLLCQK